MKKNKIIASLVLSTVLVSLSSQCVYAKDLKSNNQNIVSAKEQQVTVDKQQKETEKIQRLDKYVELDPHARKFIIKNSAYSELSKSDLQFIKDSINKSNELVKQNNQLTADTQAKRFIQSGQKSNNGISTRSIDKSKYWDWEVFWWGKRVYLHNHLIRDMQVYANTTLAGVGFTGASLGVALGVFGLPAGPIALIVAAFGFNAAYTYDRIIAADENGGHHGAYLDTFWGTGVGSYWKVYSA